MSATTCTTRPTASDRIRLLEERFQLAPGERAPAGFADRYASVYQGPRFLGLVAVDAERRVWYAAADRGRAQLEARIKASGFRHCATNSMASLYFGLATRLQAAAAFSTVPVAPAVPAAAVLAEVLAPVAAAPVEAPEPLAPAAAAPVTPALRAALLFPMRRREQELVEVEATDRVA